MKCSKSQDSTHNSTRAGFPLPIMSSKFVVSRSSTFDACTAATKSVAMTEKRTNMVEEKEQGVRLTWRLQKIMIFPSIFLCNTVLGARATDSRDRGKINMHFTSGSLAALLLSSWVLIINTICLSYDTRSIIAMKHSTRTFRKLELLPIISGSLWSVRWFQRHGVAEIGNMALVGFW